MKKRHFLIILIIGLVGILPFFEVKAPVAEAESYLENPPFSLSKVAIIQGNSFLPIVTLQNSQPVVAKRINVIVTAYSSTPWETDNTPYLTAAGTWVREGIVANNYLPFGSKIRIPELYGEKVFVVEDRMNSRVGYYHVDIWLPSYREALKFGVKRTYMEVLEN